MIHLALSCLQGRPSRQAFDELRALGPVGIQLTPGCAPSPGFLDHVAASGVPVRTHHGYTPRALRRPVWDDHGTLVGRDQSVHPPALHHSAAPTFWTVIERSGRMVETMYPGHVLGTSEELERAMALELPLAVDVSHLWIQASTVGLRRRTWRRLQRYPHVAEVHVSHNDGRSDQHRPVGPSTFGLAWARERAADGVPLVLEGRFHRLGTAERLQQLEYCGG